jgi:hypothetical protein
MQELEFNNRKMEILEKLIKWGVNYDS